MSIKLHLLYRGIVEAGQNRAEKLGFPTINIPLHDKELSGIFAGKVSVEDNSYEAALYANAERSLLEAHFLNWSAGNLYGQHVTIEVLDKIRDSANFVDDSELQRAIANDVEKVRDYFKNKMK